MNHFAQTGRFCKKSIGINIDKTGVFVIESYPDMKSKILLFCLFFLVNGVVYCFGEKIVIHARKKDYTDNLFKAEGDVEVIWQEYRIYAQYVEYHRDTGILIARGRVTMVSEGTSISGEQLTFNTRDRTGELVESYGLMKPTARFKSDRINQIDDDTLTFSSMDFTSCAQLVPRWKITCKKGRIKKEKYIVMKNVVFWIKKIPIFYIPYLKYPIEKDGRATGFLFPNFGYSDLRGYYVLNAFFWDISENFDLTVGLDYYSKVGLGNYEEIRYLFRKMHGSVKFYYFKYSQDSVFQTDSDYNYYINAEHSQRLDFLNTKITLKMNYPSDPNFLRQFNNNFDAVLSTNFNSSFSLTSSFSIFNLSVLASRYETYILQEQENEEGELEQVGQSRVTLTLPSVSLNINQKKIAKIPGYFSLKSTYESVKRSGFVLEGEPDFDSDATSNRLMLIPQYSLTLLKLPWLNASVNIESQHTFYGRSKDLETGEIVDDPLSIDYQTFKTSLKGPSFYRIFEGQKRKTKHVIEPEITFRYVTSIPEEKRDRILTVDMKDFPSYSYIGFSLTSRLITKSKIETASPIEILTLSLTQQYFLDPEAAHRERKINDIFPEFSDITGNLVFKPIQHFSLDINVSYNYYIKDFTRLSARIAYDKKDSVVGGYLSYTKNRNPYTSAEYFFNRSVIRGQLNLVIPNFPVQLYSGINYDITDNEFRSASISAYLDYQCVTLNAEFKIFNYLGREETQFNLGISFGNLGMVSDFFGEGE